MLVAQAKVGVKMRVLVLGGAGFIGRHVVRACIAKGDSVTVGCRKISTARTKLGTSADECSIEVMRFENMTERSHWLRYANNFDAIVNCVGILRPRLFETYRDVYVNAPLALARACRDSHHAPRFIHVTALGLRSNANSGFNTNKWLSEAAIKAFAEEPCTRSLDYSIVRPSLLDGEGGFGARWLRRLASWPIHFVPKSSVGLIAPLDVSELGEAIANLCGLRNRDDLREVDLGGPKAFPMSTYLRRLAAEVGLKPWATFELPTWISRPMSHLLDVFHFSPMSFGHLELMTRDNVPSTNRLALLIGRTPKEIGVKTPDVLGKLVVGPYPHELL
jgi:nucleoside-diphosphate-sugar epimerase